MSNEKLVAYYEKNLETVKAMYKDDWRKASYIQYAEGQLEAVKRGGMEELKKFWAEN